MSGEWSSHALVIDQMLLNSLRIGKVYSTDGLITIRPIHCLIVTVLLLVTAEQYMIKPMGSFYATRYYFTHRKHCCLFIDTFDRNRQYLFSPDSGSPVLIDPPLLINTLCMTCGGRELSYLEICCQVCVY